MPEEPKPYPDCPERDARLFDAEIASLKKALEEKTKRCLDYEEEQGAVLPEDRSLSEYIGSLKKALEEAREALEGVGCAMDYAQMYLEDKLEDDKDRYAEIVELPQLLKAIEARKKALTPKEEEEEG